MNSDLYGVLPAEFTATRKRLAGDLPSEQARRDRSFVGARKGAELPACVTSTKPETTR